MLRFVLVTLSFFTVVTARAENWPQPRGPLGTGVSAERDIPIIWSEARGLHWKSPLPKGSSTPAVWGDAVFVTGQSGEDLQLLRLSLKTGKTVWTQTVGRANAVKDVKGIHPHAGPAPVTDGKRVIASFANGDMAAYDFDGKQVWKRNLQEDHGPFLRTTGRASSPLLFQDTVFCTVIQPSPADVAPRPAESYVAAYSAATGGKKWKTPRKTKAVGEQAEAETTPLVLTVDERDQVIIFGGNQLDAYDTQSGKQVWSLANLTGGRTLTNPIYANDLIFAVRGGKKDTFALRPGEGELTKRNVVWERGDSSPESCSPVAWGEWLFTITDDGNVCCRHAATGNTRWKHRLPGTYLASPIVTEGRLYFLNTAGVGTVLSAAPYYDKLTENRLDDEFYVSPAVSDGRLLLRGKRNLYCVGR